MAQYSAFPVWTDAYLGDTKHLTTLEHGAYLLILFAMWRAGGQLPNDEKKLARIAGVHSNQWSRIRENIIEFMTISSDGKTLTQGRLFDEMEYVRTHSKKQAKNARSRWKNVQHPPSAVQQHPQEPEYSPPTNPLADNDGDDATASFWHCQTDAPAPTPTIVGTNVPTLSVPKTSGDAKQSPRKRIEYPADFEASWTAYPRSPNMSKAEALNEWLKLSPEERTQVLPSIEGYRAFLKAKQTCEVIHFCRYLKFRRFEGFMEQVAAVAPSPQDWPEFLSYARRAKEWSVREWGPMPGHPGCVVPDGMLRQSDGKDWRNTDGQRRTMADN